MDIPKLKEKEVEEEKRVVSVSEFT